MDEENLYCLLKAYFMFGHGSGWFSGSYAPLWSEKRSNSYGLSEEQACGPEDQPASVILVRNAG